MKENKYTKYYLKEIELKTIEKKFNDSTQPDSKDSGLYKEKISKAAKEKIIEHYKSYSS